MFNGLVKKWVCDESGAVTVDWVVLTAAIVAFGIIVVAILAPALESTAGEIASSVDGAISATA